MDAEPGRDRSSGPVRVPPARSSRFPSGAELARESVAPPWLGWTLITVSLLCIAIGLIVTFRGGGPVYLLAVLVGLMLLGWGLVWRRVHRRVNRVLGEDRRS